MFKLILKCVAYACHTLDIKCIIYRHSLLLFQDITEETVGGETVPATPHLIICGEFNLLHIAYSMN